MLVREVMNPEVEVVSPNDSVVEAARKMRDSDIGALPVFDQGAVVGMVTDRDITIRAVAEGEDLSEVTVEDVMTAATLSCNEDDDLATVSQIMADRQVRRLPVLNERKELVGMISVGDLALADQDEAGEALGGVSERRHDEPGHDLNVSH